MSSTVKFIVIDIDNQVAASGLLNSFEEARERCASFAIDSNHRFQLFQSVGAATEVVNRVEEIY